MSYKILAGTAIIAALVMNGCKGKEDEPSGGKGGNATLRITTKHHTRLIDSATVFIKYNSTTKPSVYDDSARVMKYATDTVAVFTGLKKGSYYIYGRGTDLTLTDPLVIGGVPIVINEEKEYDILCPISEAGGH